MGKKSDLKILKKTLKLISKNLEGLLANYEETGVLTGPYMCDIVTEHCDAGELPRSAEDIFGDYLDRRLIRQLGNNPSPFSVFGDKHYDGEYKEAVKARLAWIKVELHLLKHHSTNMLIDKKD